MKISTHAQTQKPLKLSKIVTIKFDNNDPDSEISIRYNFQNFSWETRSLEYDIWGEIDWKWLIGNDKDDGNVNAKFMAALGKVFT